ncbi:MAG: glycosyltransferase family 39 protein [Actinomycetota bacterium]|nr:glycosyltransferase family 39 protein [Actinomycetota bacterium]
MASPPPAAERDTAVQPLAPARPRPFAGLLDRRETALAAACLAVVGSLVVLLSRLVPDVSQKPLFGDEVLAGLTALHSLPAMLDIVISDRGGAPLHFVLAHAALGVDGSPEALRWLSVVFALAAVPLCFDLGRRLGGLGAGALAAIVAATSSMLAVYGTVGRMYALLAFVSALAIDLFVRALQRRTAGAALAAAAAAWLLPAAHPYGIVIVAIEAAVALAVWRGRSSLRPVIPILVLAAATTPFVLADVRLSERFGVGAFEPESVAPADVAAEHLGEALAAFAGGAGALALVFFGLAVAGLFVTLRRTPAFAAFALAVLAAIPILLVVARAEDSLVHLLSPRHLTFALPVWAALVGVGTARLVRDLPRPLAAMGLAGIAAAALFAPSGITDPRAQENATAASLSGPAGWVREEADPGAVLFPYSPVYLSAVPATREATPIPRSGRPLAMVRRADYPVPSVVVALPLGETHVDEPRLVAKLGPRSSAGVFPDWVLTKVQGPYAGEADVLAAARDALVDLRGSTRRRSYLFRRELRATLVTVCTALTELGEPCSRRVLPPTRRAR